MLPENHVNYAAGLKNKTYINSTSAPTATLLFKGTSIRILTVLIIASFSSRGPSLQTPGILKPNIISPGMSILAARPFPLENNTNSKLTFDMISGTSMSFPHISGIAVLLKSSHPDWSPAAIKSAIMTSADTLNLGNKPSVDQRLLPADIFATGAGRVNPSRANDPSLVYKIQPHDYLSYLCGLDYTDEQVGILAHKTVNCSDILSISEAQLNYPSFSIKLGHDTWTYTRTLTNEGQGNSTCVVQIVQPPAVDVFVMPQEVSFSELNQTMTYKVTFSRTSASSKPFGQGLQWVSDKYTARSPISV